MKRRVAGNESQAKKSKTQVFSLVRYYSADDVYKFVPQLDDMHYNKFLIVMANAMMLVYSNNRPVTPCITGLSMFGPMTAERLALGQRKEMEEFMTVFLERKENKTEEEVKQFVLKIGNYVQRKVFHPAKFQAAINYFDDRTTENQDNLKEYIYFLSGALTIHIYDQDLIQFYRMLTAGFMERAESIQVPFERATAILEQKRIYLNIENNTGVCCIWMEYYDTTEAQTFVYELCLDQQNVNQWSSNDTTVTHTQTAKRITDMHQTILKGEAVCFRRVIEKENRITYVTTDEGKFEFYKFDTSECGIAEERERLKKECETYLNSATTKQDMDTQIERVKEIVAQYDLKFPSLLKFIESDRLAAETLQHNISNIHVPKLKKQMVALNTELKRITSSKNIITLETIRNLCSKFTDLMNESEPYYDASKEVSYTNVTNILTRELNTMISSRKILIMEKMETTDESNCVPLQIDDMTYDISLLNKCVQQLTGYITTLPMQNNLNFCQKELQLLQDKIAQYRKVFALLPDIPNAIEKKKKYDELYQRFNMDCKRFTSAEMKSVQADVNQFHKATEQFLNHFKQYTDLRKEKDDLRNEVAKLQRDLEKERREANQKFEALKRDIQDKQEKKDQECILQ